MWGEHRSGAMIPPGIPSGRTLVIGTPVTEPLSADLTLDKTLPVPWFLSLPQAPDPPRQSAALSSLFLPFSSVPGTPRPWFFFW